MRVAADAAQHPVDLAVGKDDGHPGIRTDPGVLSRNGRSRVRSSASASGMTLGNSPATTREQYEANAGLLVPAETRKRAPDRLLAGSRDMDVTGKAREPRNVQPEMHARRFHWPKLPRLTG